MTTDLAILIGPTIEQLGYELADLEVKLGGRNGVVRVFIDKPDGVDLSDCEAVSRQLSAVLDAEDPLPGRYRLEVSSPGLDRKLTKPEHYRRFTGEAVRVKLRYPVDGRRHFSGALRAADDEMIEIEVDGELHSLQLATIESARLIPAL